MRGGVFVCHAFEDAGVAQRIVAALEAGGVSCWIAPRDIDPGQNYATAILEGLSAAPAVVLLFSAATSDSPHVTRELETAASAGTPIVPVRLDDVEPSAALRYYIGAAHWLDTVGTATELWEPPLVRAVRRTVEESDQRRSSSSRTGVGYPSAPRPPEHLTPTARAIAPEPEPEDDESRHRWAALGVGAVLVLVVGLVGFFVLTGNEDDPASDQDAEQSPGVAALPAGTLVWTDESAGWQLRGAQPDSSAIAVLDGGTGHEMWPQVLPGASRILYLSDSNADPMDGVGHSLRTANVDGSGDTTFLDGETFCPNPARAAVNSDGAVAVTCYDDDGERMSGIVLLTATGGFDDVLETDAAVGAVAWMPDGESLLYWMHTSDVIKGEPGQNLYLWDPESSEPIRLTETPSRDLVPAVSPDGETVAFGRILEGQQGADLYVLRLEETDDGGYQVGQEERHGASDRTLHDLDPAWVTNESIVFCQDGDLRIVDADPSAASTPALDGLDVGEARQVTVVR